MLHFLGDPEPLRQRNRISEGFIARAVCRLVLFPFCVRPFSNVRPPVRVALQAFAFCWCQPPDDPSCTLPGKHCLLVPAGCSFGRECRKRAIFAVYPPRLRVPWIQAAGVFDCHSLRIVHGVQRPGFLLASIGMSLSVSDSVACDLPRHGYEWRISPTCSPTVVARWGTGGGFLVPCVLRMVFKNNRTVRRVFRNHRNIPAAKSHTRRKCRADSVLCDRCMNLIAFQNHRLDWHFFITDSNYCSWRVCRRR